MFKYKKELFISWVKTCSKAVPGMHPVLWKVFISKLLGRHSSTQSTQLAIIYTTGFARSISRINGLFLNLYTVYAGPITITAYKY
jgi:hypothetical protein